MLRWIDDEDPLPPTWQALSEGSEAPGLLAAGGRLSVARLDQAYRHGVFPWYGPGQPVLWWAPDPRMVLPVAGFKVSRSLRKTLRRFAAAPGCEIRTDTAFERVMRACAQTPREGQSGSWIVPAMARAYADWHRAGAVHSVETWIDGELAGGLYCVSLGAMVFGESMFANRTDASKMALAALVCLCREHGVALIDCQQNTRHLASLGAHEVSREVFEQAVSAGLAGGGIADWTYHQRLWAHLDQQAGAPREARP